MSYQSKGITALDRRIARRVKIARFEIGISQTKLGNKLGVSFQQIQKYENGTNRIAAVRLHQIAKVTKRPLDYFFNAKAS